MRLANPQKIVMAGLFLVPAIQGTASMDGRDSRNPAMTFRVG
jgi:hypothetical protein